MVAPLALLFVVVGVLGSVGEARAQTLIITNDYTLGGESYFFSGDGEAALTMTNGENLIVSISSFIIGGRGELGNWNWGLPHLNGGIGGNGVNFGIGCGLTNFGSISSQRARILKAFWLLVRSACFLISS